MDKNYIINSNVLFVVAQNKLKPLGTRGVEVVLNIPMGRVLLLLLENAGNVIEQDVLLNEVWVRHGQMVTLNTLYQNISLLRKALKKAGLHLPVIRTHSKIGFSVRAEIQLMQEDSGHDTEKPVLQEIAVSPAEEGRSEVDTVSVAGNTSSRPLRRAAVLRKYKLKGSGLRRASTFRVNYFYLSVFSLCAVLFLVILTTFLTRNNEFSSTHDLVARVNKCPVYIDKSNRNTNLSRIINYMKEQMVTCAHDDFIYLTRNLHRAELLVFTCSPLPDNELKCVTTMKLPDYLYPKRSD
ncbi:winged helix-turn-helix domain-containing protein [Enterobacter bugandensis]|uniref:winged helix-turn-helix domain-containing protein n=1 Tax=Enterobacter bugandensis TaxID=881260 RepID=UPI0023B19A46|nr:winged helix-turn-helix domain-containing protein [Enterobacter bugandensis]MDE7590821.1 winged helix-turn-helix domain-containing protein [Enterobacter bugandensis]